MLISFAVYAIIVVVASGIIRVQTGVVINPIEFYRVMLVAPIGIVALAALCGIFPAIKAYRTDVASSMSPLS